MRPKDLGFIASEPPCLTPDTLCSRVHDLSVEGDLGAKFLSMFSIGTWLVIAATSAILIDRNQG